MAAIADLEAKVVELRAAADADNASLVDTLAREVEVLAAAVAVEEGRRWKLLGRARQTSARAIVVEDPQDEVLARVVVRAPNLNPVNEALNAPRVVVTPGCKAVVSAVGRVVGLEYADLKDFAGEPPA